MCDTRFSNVNFINCFTNRFINDTLEDSVRIAPTIMTVTKNILFLYLVTTGNRPVRVNSDALSMQRREANNSKQPFYHYEELIARIM